MPEATLNNTNVEPSTDPAIREMIEAGLFFGRKKTHTHPRMKPFILNNRSGVEIINLHKTAEALESAVAFVKDIAAKNGLLLLVATEPSIEDAVQETARALGIPFVTRRWLGGSLTNFKVISKRIDYFKKLRSDWNTGAFQKYTKKERVGIEREMKRLEELLGGLELMTRTPDAIIMIDPTMHSAAVAEARQLKIPLVALTNVDTDPDLITHLIPGNSRARQSSKWFLSKMSEAVTAGKKHATERAAEMAAKEQETAKEQKSKE